jgi:hypothetical protein
VSATRPVTVKVSHRCAAGPVTVDGVAGAAPQRRWAATAPLSAVCLTDAGRFVRCVRCSRRPVAVIGLRDAIYLGGAVEGPLTLRSGRGSSSWSPP